MTPKPMNNVSNCNAKEKMENGYEKKPNAKPEPRNRMTLKSPSEASKRYNIGTTTTGYESSIPFGLI